MFHSRNTQQLFRVPGLIRGRFFERQYHHQHSWHPYNLNARQVKYSPLAGSLTKQQILELPSTPAASPSYPRGPYTFYNREYFIIEFESDPIAIRKRVPEPLEPAPGNKVLYEWISMPDSTGFGSYTESGIVIPCLFQGEHVNFTQSMYLDCEPPIAGGREIWGFPKKYARPVFSVKNDTIFGRLHYANEEVAMGTMVYKHQAIPEIDAMKSLSKTSVNLKVIPDVDYKPKIAQLVAYNLTNIKFKGAWTGPARLVLKDHINAPVADFPVKRIHGGKHYLADITLPYGRILHDYLSPDAHKTSSCDPQSSSTFTTIAHVNKQQQHHFIPVSEKERTKHGFLTRDRILASSCMPLHAPSFKISTSIPTQLRNIKHVDREYFIIKYHSTDEAIRACLPDLLYPTEDNSVLLTFVHTAGGGIGDYCKVDVFIPCCDQHGRQFNFGTQSYVDSSASITMGREVFGMPQKFGHPALSVVGDTLTGTLTYSGLPVCRGTMGFKTAPLDSFVAQSMLAVPHLGLKLIPDVKGEAAVAQLVRSDRTDIVIKSSFHGQARLDIQPHVSAPIADLPLVPGHSLEAFHIVCDLVQPVGVVEHDYLSAALHAQPE